MTRKGTPAGIYAGAIKNSSGIVWARMGPLFNSLLVWDSLNLELLVLRSPNCNLACVHRRLLLWIHYWWFHGVCCQCLPQSLWLLLLVWCRAARVTTSGSCLSLQWCRACTNHRKPPPSLSINLGIYSWRQIKSSLFPFLLCGVKFTNNFFILTFRQKKTFYQPII